MIRPPLPSTGVPWGGFPGFTGTMEGSDSSSPHPGPLRHRLEDRYRRPRASFAPSGCPLGIAGVRSARSGSPLDPRRCFDGGKEASQVPGGPSRTCPALRPRRVRLHLAHSGRRCCLPPCQRRRHPRVDFRGSITRPVRSLSTLHDDGHPPPRKTRFRLGTSLGRAGRHLQGPSARFLR
jgi:hypothetical protein